MMSPDDPTSLTATALIEALASHRLSAVDVMDATLARIAALEPRLHAFTEVYAQDARLAAQAADAARRAGHAVGPLHGIPVALKDLIQIEGRLYGGGSAVFRDRRATTTASLVRRLIGAGLIVLGKTHTTEFAYSGWGTNEHLGTPLNPWDLATPRVPGGSSSGSGVAVAAAFCPWAVGTDTGGSVRLPAAFCGVVGLKVTFGRISCHGIQPLSTTLDSPGPIARTVRDAALLYDAMQGADPLDPNTARLPPDTPLRLIDRGVRGLRLGRIAPAERAGVDDAILAAYDDSLAVLSRLGAELVEFVPPQPFLSYAADFLVTPAEAYAAHGHLADDSSLPLDPAVRRRILAGRISARDYLAALAKRAEAETAFADAFADLDGLVLPTTPMPPIPLSAVDQDVLPSRFTRFVNLLGLCALSLPNGATAEGLPTSLQIVCRGGEEAQVVRIGAAFERATEWHERRPALAA
jgi:aspartyl-tRNA(Asn)/glutamyl-tRNA(Gln) amidotransferase subunit A